MPPVVVVEKPMLAEFVNAAPRASHANSDTTNMATTSANLFINTVVGRGCPDGRERSVPRRENPLQRDTEIEHQIRLKNSEWLRTSDDAGVRHPHCCIGRIRINRCAD